MADLLTDEFYEGATQHLVDIANETSNKVVEVIANRINEIGTLTDTDVTRIRSIMAQSDLNEIEKIVARQTKRSYAEIDEIFEKVAKRNELMTKVYYDYQGIEYERSAFSKAIIKASVKSAKDEYLNMSRAFSLTLNKQVTPLSTAYNKILDRAIYEVTSGTTDYFAAMRSTIKEISKNGVVVDGRKMAIYETRRDGTKALSWMNRAGQKYYTRRLDSSVRMNIMDGARQMSLNMLQQAGKEFGADGVEISAHALCRADHQEAQGHIFTNKEFEELQNELETPIATGEFNCGHIAYPVIVEIAEQNYTEEQLQDFIDSSNEVVTFTGLSGEPIAKTRYDCTQYQRNLETTIRQKKEQALALEKAGDTIGSAKAKKQAREYSKQYRSISAQMGLNAQPKRLRVWV